VIAAGLEAEADRDFLTAFGLWDEKDPTEEYLEAVALLEADDTDGARVAAAEVRAALDAAVPRGRWRWNLALGAATAAWIVGSLIVAGILKIFRHIWRRLRARRLVEA
jgi:hypothetical protein